MQWLSFDGGAKGQPDVRHSRGSRFVVEANRPIDVWSPWGPPVSLGKFNGRSPETQSNECCYAEDANVS